jgi:hypothetical protein
MTTISRNDALGFAARAKKNLAHIEQAFAAGADVHVVTQLGMSLLGLIVFPQERHLVERVSALDLSALEIEGWPRWQQDLGHVDTLGELIRYLRNAVAHGRLKFSSDARSIEDVSIEVENYRPNEDVPNWRASIPAVELRDFCLRFVQLIEDTIG